MAAKIVTIFYWNFEIWAVQRVANLVDCEKCWKMSIYLQKLASIKPSTSPLKLRFLHALALQPSPLPAARTQDCNVRRAGRNSQNWQVLLRELWKILYYSECWHSRELAILIYPVYANSKLAREALSLSRRALALEVVFLILCPYTFLWDFAFRELPRS